MRLRKHEYAPIVACDDNLESLRQIAVILPDRWYIEMAHDGLTVKNFDESQFIHLEPGQWVAVIDNEPRVVDSPNDIDGWEAIDS